MPPEDELPPLDELEELDELDDELPPLLLEEPPDEPELLPPEEELEEELDPPEEELLDELEEELELLDELEDELDEELDPLEEELFPQAVSRSAQTATRGKVVALHRIRAGFRRIMRYPSYSLLRCVEIGAAGRPPRGPGHGERRDS